MAHIDAALLISICLVYFLKMYRPITIDKTDIFNIKGKIKVLVENASNIDEDEIYKNIDFLHKSK